MRNNRIFLATMAVAMLSVASCQKESSVFQEFSACMEEGASDAKTTLVNSSLQWQHGTDQVSITGIATTTNTTDNTTSIQTTTSTFTAVVHSSYPNNLSYANLELNSDQTALTEPSTNTTVSYRAIYPASIAGNNNTQVTLPQIQASTRGELTGYPMYAQSDNKSLQFKNLCSVLKLSLTGTETINKIEVVTDKYLCGTFNINASDPSNPTLEADNTTHNNNTRATLTMSSPVTLSSSASYFYIYLPVQTYKYIKINVYNEDNLVYSKAAQITNGVTLERSKYHDLALSTPEFEPGILCGEFSVSPTLKVSFSKGNLIIGSREITETTSNYSYSGLFGVSSGTYVSDISTVDVFKFADNQYDRNGVPDADIDPSYGQWLFEWGLSSTSSTQQKWWNYSSNSSRNVHTTGLHYESQAISYFSSLQGVDNVDDWRCLTQPEWDYLLSYTSNRMQYHNISGELQRNDINRGFVLATVCGIHGMIIFPDVFYWPLDEKEATFGNTSYGNWGGDNNSYDSDQWNILESAGCVFLPTTGYKHSSNDDYTSTENQNIYGAYWGGAKVQSANSPKFLLFSNTQTSAFSDNQNGNEIDHYHAIRLVKNN